MLGITGLRQLGVALGNEMEDVLNRKADLSDQFLTLRGERERKDPVQGARIPRPVSSIDYDFIIWMKL